MTLKLAKGIAQCPDCELIYMNGSTSCPGCETHITLGSAGDWCPDCVKTALAYHCMLCKKEVMMAEVIKFPCMFRGTHHKEGFQMAWGCIPNPKHKPEQNEGMCDDCCTKLLEEGQKIRAAEQAAKEEKPKESLFRQRRREREAQSG